MGITLSRIMILVTMLSAIYMTPSLAIDSGPTEDSLKIIKLGEEIEKLRLENKKQKSMRGTVIDFAPFMTALVAIISVGIAFWKFMLEHRRQRKLDRRERESERIHRFDNNFTSVVNKLGSTNLSVQASAAVSMLIFLKKDYSEFHEQVFFVLLANSKVPHERIVQEFISKSFERALKLISKTVGEENLKTDDKDKDSKIVLDLSGCTLIDIFLPNINLSWANIKNSNFENADFRESNLRRLRGDNAILPFLKCSNANLWKARLPGAILNNANFGGATLIQTHFEGANLENCTFRNAKLQSSHFKEANLKGAKFEHANLKGTSFIGATFDDISKKSIVKAKNWRDAMFDSDVFKELQKIELKMRTNK